VVLAGGRSTRFGRGDKLAAPVGGMPLLHHAVLRLADVTDDVVVVLAPDALDPVLPPGAPVRWVRDEREGEGPLAGALAGLGAVDRDLAIVVGGDMPTLSTVVLIEMVRVARQDGVDVVALLDDGRVRPLPVVVRADPARRAAHALLREGERSLRSWLQTMRVAVIDEPTWTGLDPERATLRDVDVPSDLDR
jgi:molybdopterin-guanine dinucleotide biosynthesis protein A